MIALLRGEVVATLGSSVVVDVNGVGYEVTAAMTNPPMEGQVSFIIKTVVRDDSIVLIGFTYPSDRELFDLLTSVPAVGPAVAISALRTYRGDELRMIIANGDAEAVKKIAGVGSKTAQRIVMELATKVGRPVLTHTVSSPSSVVEALAALGFSQSEIHQALDGVVLPDNEAEALREALKYVSGT
jgi:holliday junction DNA helicase RuvA